MWKPILFVLLFLLPCGAFGNINTAQNVKKGAAPETANKTVPVMPDRITGQKKPSRLKRTVKWLKEHYHHESCPLCTGSSRDYYPH